MIKNFKCRRIIYIHVMHSNNKRTSMTFKFTYFDYQTNLLCQRSFLLKLLGDEKKSKGFCCKVCGGLFEIDKNKKIRQRNVYCSRKCASLGHKEQMQNFWTNKITLRLGFR